MPKSSRGIGIELYGFKAAGPVAERQGTALYDLKGCGSAFAGRYMVAEERYGKRQHR
ncbi:MAG: hypothetical protein AB8B97_06375 [Granulosicoccus sp.]